MRLVADTLWLAPTDLGNHLDCPHLTTLALANARGDGPAPHEGGEYEELIQRKGDEHERAYIDGLVAQGRQVERIARGGDFDAAQRATIAAMRAGAEVISQATFALDGWRGRADFLERTATPTDLGDWGYEAVDTKLARGDAHPHHVLQLGIYSDWIAGVQGVAPVHMHLQLGSGVRETIRVADVAAYVRRAQQRLRAFVDDPPATEALPCAHCQVCGFRSHCEAEWEATDHLTRVANLTRGHLPALRAAGIGTLAQLATADATPVPDIAPDTLANLRWQARLQHAGRGRAVPPFEHRPAAQGRGLARLPEPDEGDIFLDLEGDPLWEPARELWFLFGLVLLEDGQWRYRQIWAHDPATEQDAFAELIDLIAARRADHPGMHVYHYSHAEPSALRRLAAQPGTREPQVDDLLRAEAFVDLYTVTRQAFVIGARSYGLKSVERLAGFTRGAEVGAGADAVVAYEHWRHDRDAARLDQIARYNEEDCLATLALRDWLVAQRPQGSAWWTPGGGEVEVREPSPEELARLAVRAALVDEPPVSEVRRLAGEALEYHRRDARPEWWHYFKRLEMTREELLADGGALAGLELTGDAPLPVSRSLEYTLRFPPQGYNLGHSPYDPEARKGVNVTAIDDAAGTITISRAVSRGDELPWALIPGGPIQTTAQRQALLRVAESIRSGAGDSDSDGARHTHYHRGDGASRYRAIESICSGAGDSDSDGARHTHYQRGDGAGRYRAIEGLLAKAPPPVAGRTPGAPLQTEQLTEQLALAAGLDHGTLLVQGPPGTGKTWLGARIVAELMAGGQRVGVTAVSHRAIDNLVDQTVVAAAERGLAFRGVRKVGDGWDGAGEGDGPITHTADNAECERGDWDLVAGTAWLFAREGMDQRLDWLVIDEAGQMSLADAMAVATSARNLVLLGDPQQLPHVSQAIHVPGLGASVLEYLLGDHHTVPPDRGLFLATTRRMHPDICGFVSREIYDGRLRPHPSCARQATALGTGIRHLPVAHSGRTSSSVEEAQAIAAEMARLVGTEWTNADGQIGVLTEGDIMVVAPYNAQVRVLRAVLGPGVRVGTVDKFQGQEAPVVFFSMATSSGEEMPRDVGFLFSRNRLNVAISRARCLAYVVCSPALLDARPATVADMRLISTLCALVEEAERQGRA